MQAKQTQPSTTVLPSASVTYTSARNTWEDSPPPACALLDSCASMSFISEKAARAADIPMEKAAYVTKVRGIAATTISTSKQATVTIYGNKGYKHSISMKVLPSIGVVESINLTPDDLGISGIDLADEWPSKRRCIDMLLGQDVLWDLQHHKCQAITGQPKLVAEETKLGIVLHGVYNNPQDKSTTRETALSHMTYLQPHPTRDNRREVWVSVLLNTNQQTPEKQSMPTVPHSSILSPRPCASRPVSYTHLTLPTTPYV